MKLNTQPTRVPVRTTDAALLALVNAAASIPNPADDLEDAAKRLLVALRS